MYMYMYMYIHGDYFCLRYLIYMYNVHLYIHVHVPGMPGSSSPTMTTFMRMLTTKKQPPSQFSRLGTQVPYSLFWCGVLGLGFLSSLPLLLT